MLYSQRGEAVALRDAWLDGFRLLGAALTFYVGLFGVLMSFEHPISGACLGAYALLLLIAHLLLPLAAPAWRAAEGLWALGVPLLCSMETGYLNRAQWAALAAAPALMLGTMLASRRPMLARLNGEAITPVPPRETPGRFGGCEDCGDRNARVLAPLYCMSFVVVTTRVPGSFRRVCSRHALLRALPASVVSATLGWWGFPWGLFWTPMVLLQNLVSGGVELDSSEFAELRALEPEHGRWFAYVPGTAFIVGLLVLPMAFLLLVDRLGS